MAAATCPRCGGQLQIDPQYAGWQVRCPHCATEFTAGAEAAPAGDDAPPPVAAVAPGYDPPPTGGGSGVVLPPAICLLVVAVLGLGCFGATIFGLMVQPDPLANDPRRNDPAFRAGAQIGKGLVLVVMPLWSVGVAAGAGCMMTRRAYPLAFAGCILAMLPCNHMCLLGLPFGIWGLIALNSEGGRAAFDAGRREY
jgi:hypothetical protein